MADALQHRLATQLRQRILEGHYQPGTAFPSYRSIADEYGAGRGATYRAVQALRDEGLLEGTPRSRLTVRHAAGVRTLAYPDAEWPYGRGDAERGRQRADVQLAARLACPPHASVTWERVELLDPDGRPAMILTTWRTGRRRPHETARISVATHRLTQVEAHLLGLLTGTLALLVDRTRYDVAGAVTEVADLVLPADRWTVGG
ncbi:GntR family transcriptional regulator [Streptomyces sp. H27-G5]|uniref:GntR family transcriptional regulator n=1 Tax=Streptomyces sp. H27-G5 TaxID=2996698 RepID=UPI0022704467|nr:GntR family transcriptional regulator [Streptomyces sp. H27-G5]MCY0917083.1 GntR family transcriptional regulator [Streptomyces sp. H27-G5]